MSPKFKNFFPADAYKTFVEQSPLSIIFTDKNGNIVYVNLKFIELTGYTYDEVLGKNPRILKSGDKRQEEYKSLWNTILSGEVWKGEFLNKKKDGILYNEFAVISPIRNQEGEIINFIAVKEDITELRKATEELKKSEKLAMIGKMTAYLSHEIKTPLTSIKINIDLLERNNSINADAQKSILIIQKEIGRLKNLLKNILQFSNPTKIYIHEINLHKKIENIHEFLKPLLDERKVTLINNTSEHYIYGDAQQLRSLFIHLIENSIDSMNSEGTIEINSELKEEYCYIYLKDNGCGMTYTENIFEPFFTTKSSGTGLGLPIAKNIVDNIGGSISLISSRPGETIFEIVLKSRGEKIGKASNN